MRSILGLAIAWFSLALGLAHAAPARLLYQPDPEPALPKQVAVDLNGTTWQGKYLATARMFTFEADGTLSYRGGTAKAATTFLKNRGLWKLEGNKIYFEHHIGSKKNVMEFRGIVTDANTIVGEATFLNTGAKEKQTMQRTTPSPK